MNHPHHPHHSRALARLRVVPAALLLAWAAAALPQAFAGPRADPGEGTPEQTFQLALEAQAAREYRAMVGLLRQAAQGGNLDAQEMLGMALLAGPVVYGSAVKADRCEAWRWMHRAAAQGSEVAQYQLSFLNRLRQGPGGKAACLEGS